MSKGRPKLNRELEKLERRREDLRDGLLAAYWVVRVASRKLRQCERKIERTKCT